MTETYIDSDGSTLVIEQHEDGKWYFNSTRVVLHRLDGPAVECPNGHKEWWVQGKKVEPLFLVSHWLERGRCCWFDETTNELRFGDDN